MKWIKTKDALPKPLEDILVYGSSVCKKMGCTDVGEKKTWCAYMQRDGKFLTLEYRCEINTEYWMYLPEYKND